MNAWITFWTAVLAIGLSAYFLVALIVIPLGAIDIKRMFSQLDSTDKGSPAQEGEDEHGGGAIE